MSLASFDQVYNCYDQLARHCYSKTMAHIRGVEYMEHAWQPYKLLEAYAMGFQALEEHLIVRTPEWARQTGATTAAIAMALTSEDVVMLVSDIPAAKYASRMIMSAYPPEAKSRRAHVKPNIIHNKVWWMSGINQCAHGRPIPKLVVCDSDSTYSKRAAREEGIEFVHGFGCAVLVLEAPKQYVYLF